MQKYGYVESCTGLPSAQGQVTGGQRGGRGWPKKLIFDTVAVLVEGTSGSVCREEEQAKA